MTEAEWLACGDPVPMLESMRGTTADRKLRLFAVACCQRLLRRVRLHPWYAHGLEVAGHFADGEVNAYELERVRRYPPPEWGLQYAPRSDPAKVSPGGLPNRVSSMAITACWDAMGQENGLALADCAAGNAAWAASQPGPVMPDDGGISAARLAAELVVQSIILRDIFGSPFRPVTFLPAWRSSTVLALATAMYAVRDFSPLPILADALMDAGCTDESILTHCRGPGPHVRGCWCLDACLGKS